MCTLIPKYFDKGHPSSSSAVGLVAGHLCGFLYFMALCRQSTVFHTSAAFIDVSSTYYNKDSILRQSHNNATFVCLALNFIGVIKEQIDESVSKLNVSMNDVNNHISLCIELSSLSLSTPCCCCCSGISISHQSKPF